MLRTLIIVLTEQPGKQLREGKNMPGCGGDIASDRCVYEHWDRWGHAEGYNKRCGAWISAVPPQAKRTNCVHSRASERETKAMTATTTTMQKCINSQTLPYTYPAHFNVCANTLRTCFCAVMYTYAHQLCMHTHPNVSPTRAKPSIMVCLLLSQHWLWLVARLPWHAYSQSIGTE